MTIYDDRDAVADSKYDNDTVIRAIHEKLDERPDLKINRLQRLQISHAPEGACLSWILSPRRRPRWRDWVLASDLQSLWRLPRGDHWPLQIGEHRGKPWR